MYVLPRPQAGRHRSVCVKKKGSVGRLTPVFAVRIANGLIAKSGKEITNCGR